MKKLAFLFALTALGTFSEVNATQGKQDKQDKGPVESAPTKTSSDHNGVFYTGAKLSTLGLGVEIGYYYNPYFGTRAMFNWLSLKRDFNRSGVTYRTEMRLLSAGILADFHPLKSGFKISAGLVYQDNRFAARPRANQPTTIAGILFQPEILRLIKGVATFKNHTAPYIGIGYDSNHGQKKALSWFVDAGVFYHGPVRVKIYTDKPLDPGLKEGIKNHYTKELNSSNFVRWYPVVAIGLRWQFASR